MRRTLLALTVALAGLAAATGPASASFDAPIPLPAGQAVLTATQTPDGSTLLGRGGATNPYSSTATDLVIQRVTGAAVTTTAVRHRAALVRGRPAADGSAELLVFASPSGSAYAPGQLTLLHLSPDGRLQT